VLLAGLVQVISVPDVGAAPPVNACVGGSSCHSTIQAAVDAASAGGTVTVNAGTYDEDVVTTDKVMDFLGVGTPVIRGSITFGATVGTATNLTGSSSVSGFAFERPSGVAATVETYKMVAASGSGHDVAISLSTFDLQAGTTGSPTPGRGAALSGTARWMVAGNVFENHEHGGVDASSTLFLSGAGRSLVDGNDFRDAGQGVLINGAAAAGSEITNNLFGASTVNTLVRGIETDASDLLIEGNTFEGFGWNLVIDGGRDNLVANNFFDGRSMSADGGQVLLRGAHSGNVFRDNRFGASSKALRNQTADAQVDARQNYWDLFSSNETFITLGLGRTAGAPAAEPDGWTSVDINAWMATLPALDPSRTGDPGFWPVGRPVLSPLSALPSISVTSYADQTVTGTTGVWTGDPTFAFQWQASQDGGLTWGSIAGATTDSLTLSSALDGLLVKLRVSASNVDGTMLAFSAPVAAPLVEPVLPAEPETAPPAPTSAFVSASDGTVPAAAPGSAVVITAAGVEIESQVSVTDESGGEAAVVVATSGLTVTVSGDGGATEASGAIAAPGGEIAVDISSAIDADIPAGSVVEIWLFSTPRLVAAAEADVDGQVGGIVPLSAPLDGGEAIPAGAHTLQLIIPTTSGIIAFNVGVTVGGPVPTSVPSGVSPSSGSPTLPFVLLAASVALGVVMLRRRDSVAPVA